MSGEPHNLLLINGDGGTPITDIANLDSSENWWVRDHGNDFRPFYSSSSSSGDDHNAYERYGLEEGDFGSFVKFHTGGLLIMVAN